MSPHYVDPAPDWPDQLPIASLDSRRRPRARNEGQLADEGKRDFLAKGPAPVVVTLGTSGASARPEVFEQVAATLDRLEALVACSSPRTRRSPNGFETTIRGTRTGHGRFTPLAPLLPRASGPRPVGCTRHRTRLALEAGVPSVIVPCLFDQLWHARRQQQLGIGIWVRRPATFNRQSTGCSPTRSLSRARRPSSAPTLRAEHGTRRRRRRDRTLPGDPVVEMRRPAMKERQWPS